MSMTQDNAINRHASGDWSREENDWCIEPAWCWQALADTVPAVLTGSILDPACGSGVGLRWCRERGLTAWGSDIVDRGCGALVADFLAPGYPLRADAIVSNPPYKHAVEFARQSLHYASQSVALLVQAPFLFSQRRHVLFTATPVSDIVILSKRPSMPPGGRSVKPGGGKEDYVWVCWRHGYQGAPAIHWAMP